jgi:TPR repeat protein
MTLDGYQRSYALVELAVGQSEIAVALRLAKPLIDAGDAHVQWYLGDFYHRGWYGGPDIAKARDWYQKAASLGSTQAGAALEELNSRMLASAQRAVNSKDQPNIATETENWQYSLDILGDKVSRCSAEDYERMYRWYRRGAEHGDAEKQHLIGMLYEYGIHVRSNPRSALKWYSLAAGNGNHEASIWYDRLLANGYIDELRRQHKEKCKVYNDQIIDGCCRGLGQAPEGDVETFQWYLRLAEQGDPDAQLQVFHCYMRGKGVRKNRTMLAVWLTLVYERHPNEVVRTWFMELYNLLDEIVSERGMRRAQKLVQEYKARWASEPV